MLEGRLTSVHEDAGRDGVQDTRDGRGGSGVRVDAVDGAEAGSHADRRADAVQARRRVPRPRVALGQLEKGKTRAETEPFKHFYRSVLIH